MASRHRKRKGLTAWSGTFCVSGVMSYWKRLPLRRQTMSVKTKPPRTKGSPSGLTKHRPNDRLRHPSFRPDEFEMDQDLTQTTQQQT
ncbi:hypothetical protein NDU88_002216 [Pleurodeles waltl]|uniref:Uncharacterized protein n=1 Tax=Pleurodeles waltl TaxID=8319 RepID=A0AAV7UCI5_PLEWA|nr:hypothetical protein NDU88_002216 [Pleurodeles waltl]